MFGERQEEEKDSGKSKLLAGTRSKGGTEEPPGERDARRQDVNSVGRQTGLGSAGGPGGGE